MAVVLPAPLGPRKPHTSPASTRKENPDKAVIESSDRHDRKIHIRLIGLDSELAGQQKLDRGIRADVRHGDLTVFVDHKQSGNAVDVPGSRDSLRDVKEDREGQFRGGSIGFGGRAVVVDADGKDLEVRAIFVGRLVEALQHRHLNVTGSAPARPKYQNNVLLPAEIG
jgi:hypothetical protein